MRRICVYAGSNLGSHPAYPPMARQLGQTLANQGITLVYGGGRSGLMGCVADAALQAHGHVIGVMPSKLFDKEIVHPQLTQLIEVDTMHERKAKMADLADAFIALPGGCGTWEELLEVITWKQIGIHNKPIGLFNIEGYYNPLFHMIKHGIKNGFIPSSTEEQIFSISELDQLFQFLHLHSNSSR